jgi:V/A-type H+-transporting ATPase subunit I
VAIAEMEKLALTFNEKHLDGILRLMQGFQGIHIETGYEASIPPAKKDDITKTIRETEKNLQEIQAAAGIIKERKPTKMLSSLRNSEEKKLSISEFTEIVGQSDWENILEEIIHTDRWLRDNRKRRKEVSKRQNEMKLWEQLICNPLDFVKLQRTAAFFGSVHIKHDEEFSEILIKHENDGVAFEKPLIDEDRAYYLVFCHNSFLERFNLHMNEYSFSVKEYPFEKPQNEAKIELEAEEKKLIRDEKEINRLIAEQSKYEEILAFAEDYNLNTLLRMKMSLEVTYDGEDVEIEGWIISEKRGQFERLIAKHIPAADYRLTISPVKDTDIDDVPIKLKNGRLAAVYERLTEMYSLPRYNELDPTPVITVFYLIFFGLMVADVGYGFSIFLIGQLVRKVLKVRRSTKSFVDFLYYLSFPIMAWGLIFGSFYGLRLPFRLLSATVDIIPMTVISIVLGYFQIMTGLVLYIVNQVKLRKYYDMASGGLAWFLTFLGGGLMLLAKAAPWFDGRILFVTGGVISGAGIATIIIIPAIMYGKRWLAGVGKGLYALYGATSYLGDFISYTRLMALGVAGGSVALAFNTILKFLPIVLRFTLGVALAVILHALNIFLSMLSAYVHGIRLQFIEFFGKFYTGGGKKFEPFKAAEKNIIIIDSEKS